MMGRNPRTQHNYHFLSQRNYCLHQVYTYILYTMALILYDRGLKIRIQLIGCVLYHLKGLYTENNKFGTPIYHESNNNPFSTIDFWVYLMLQ